MLFLKYLLYLVAAGLFTAAAAVLIQDVRRFAGIKPRWREAGRLAALAFLPLLLGLSLVVAPSGTGGVVVSQISGILPGTLYGGTHWLVPLVQRAVFYDIRDQVYQTAAAADPELPLDVLKVQTREGLIVGVAVAVRYRLDPLRLSYVHASLPQAYEREIVAAAVDSAFREVAPYYTTGELFASKRDEVRRRVAETLTRKLAADGIVVKEVLVRDVLLPDEYTKRVWRPAANLEDCPPCPCPQPVKM